ncbi:SpvB/TcaC N-terminal domain-containing protein [Kribbella sp. NPDC023855]|uniref:SpvB/TcaC N-terminal domain-containing protein n=1 Tax=Kribbella sp. NPDC023855 TaxID=3154698 RepID=UPI0033D9F435
MRALVVASWWRSMSRASLAAAMAVVVSAGVVQAIPLAASTANASAGEAVVPVSGPAFGGTSGNASVGDGGSARYTVPLKIVPGRGGFEPQLALSYSSDTSDGPVGVGFGLTGLSQISRCAKTLAEDGVSAGVGLNAGDRFCLDGQKLIAVNGGVYGADSTEYRTKRDTHVRVKSYRTAGTPAWVLGPTHFTVEKPDGTVSTTG